MSSSLKERLFGGVFLGTALTSILAVILICLFLFANGIPVIQKIGFLDFFTGTSWTPTDSPAKFGILPMILGSIYVTAGAILIGVFIGVMTSVFMAKFCPNKLYPYLKNGINILAGIPSVVYGFFGLIVIVPFIRTHLGGTGSCILTTSILLGLMILPTIISVSENSIRGIPKSYYESALALGASHERSVFFVCLPAAKSGILAGIILGTGRAIGETMAVILVAGNQARIPGSVLEGARTLTANIVLEMGYAANLHRDALIATGVVLFVFILFINSLFSVLKQKASV